MKKMFLGILALSLLSATPSYAIGGKKKAVKKKAKIECTKNCPDTKNCHKTANCPNRPGCYCN